MDGNVLQESSPDSLTNQSIRAIFNHPFYFFFEVEKNVSSGQEEKVTGSKVCHLKKWKTHDLNYHDHQNRNSFIRQLNRESQTQLFLRLRPYDCLPLPEKIYQEIFGRVNEEGFDLTDFLVAAFGDPNKTLLHTIKLRNSTLTDDGLRELCSHKIESLDIMYCKNLTEKSLETINRHFKESLKELKISGNWTQDLNSGLKVHSDNSIFPMVMESDFVDTDVQDETNNTSYSQNSTKDAPPMKQPHQASTLSTSLTPSSSKILTNLSILSSAKFVMQEKQPCVKYVIKHNTNLEIYGNLKPMMGALPNSEINLSDLSKNTFRASFTLDTPKLEKLTLHSLLVTHGLSYFPVLFKSLTNLSHLDISNCYNQDGMDKFKWLPKYLKNTLQSLIMYNVREIDLEAIENICKLTRLKHLDISKVPEDKKVDFYQNPNQVLAMIVENLPELRSLDISATNLAGDGTYQSEENQSDMESHETSASPKNSHEGHPPKKMKMESSKCDIVGLKSRCENPLDFLGLYSCIYVPCFRTHIPAKEISGHKDERQLMVACQTCLDRPSPFPTTIFIDLLKYFEKTKYENAKDFLKIILLMMKKHPDDESVQKRGLECLYYIANNIVNDNIEMNFQAKKNIVESVLNVMFWHKDDADLIDTACCVLLRIRKRNLNFAGGRFKKFHDYFIEHYELENNESFQRPVNLVKKLMRQLER